MSTTYQDSDVERAELPALSKTAVRGGNAAAQSDSNRAIAETQAAMVIAQQFPRNQVQALDRITQAFTRQSLAESALYSYARAGTDITGPSIRAAETIAQNWGNLQFGVRELEQRHGESTVEAFCWDVETNTRSTKVFQVPHERHTRSGVKKLEDPRDIYELVANQGARRLRACILSIIPGDVIEAAIAQADTTMRTKIKITPETIASLVEKFEAIGVPKRALEARIQRRIDVITPALVVQLGKIYNSINDGMSAAGEWFDLATPQDEDSPKSRAQQLRDQLAAKAAKASPPAADGEVAVAAANAAPAAPSPELDDQQIVIAEVTAAATARGLNAKALAKLIKGATGQEEILTEHFDSIMLALEQLPVKGENE